jgi:hypothetical protein
MPLHTSLIVVCLFVLVVLLWPRRRSFVTVFEDLIKKLHPNEIAQLHEFLNQDFYAHHQKFWIESGQTLGLWRRWHNMTILAYMTQLTFREGYISREDGVNFLGQIFLFSAYTILALPEAAVCSIWDSVPHVLARASFDAYCSLVARAFCLCSHEEAPECVVMIAKML